jgi:hypothetical protein
MVEKLPVSRVHVAKDEIDINVELLPPWTAIKTKKTIRLGSSKTWI